MNFLNPKATTSLVLAPFYPPSNGLFGLIPISQKNSKGLVKVELFFVLQISCGECKWV
jgi:hypothetical protein